MELKRILARDTRSAMEQAIKTYGPDVLVISNHQVNGQTELVVAIEAPGASSAQPGTETAATADTPAPAAETTPATEPSGSGQSFRQSLQAVTQPTARAAAEPAVVETGPTAASRSDQDARDYLRSREIVELVRDEIAALRREFRIRQQTSAWQSGLHLAPAVTPLAQALQETEMPGALRALMLESLSQASDTLEGLQILREQLLHTLKRAAAELPTRGLHLLAGPSGAGKTLMAARLARHAAQAGCEQVALISFQDVRAGAWSQMQMLAAQLGVDAFRATDTHSLRILIDELSHRSLVLIDTPGVQMAEHVHQVLEQAPACQCHAVLPADASTATLQRVFGQGLPLQSLLLTKTDEANSGWSLLQFLSDNAICLSGASQGAGLSELTPDFKIEQLVDLALAPLAASLSPDMESSTSLAGGDGAVGQAGIEKAGLAAVLNGIAGLPSTFMATADILGAGSGTRHRQPVGKSPAKPAARRTTKTSAPITDACDPSPAHPPESRVRKSAIKPTASASTRATRRKVAEVTAQP